MVGEIRHLCMYLLMKEKNSSHSYGIDRLLKGRVLGVRVRCIELIWDDFVGALVN